MPSDGNMLLNDPATEKQRATLRTAFIVLSVLLLKQHERKLRLAPLVGWHMAPDLDV